MVAQHYRWDFIGLSSQEKPTPATSEKVVDGSTFYEGDTSKLYVFCKDTWYEKTATGGGGGTTYTAGDGIDITDSTISVDLVQTTGTDTKKVMSQDATTKMIYPKSLYSISIGDNSITTTSQYYTAICASVGSTTDSGIAIGSGSSRASLGSQSRAYGSVVIGADASNPKGYQNIVIGRNAYANPGVDYTDTYDVAIGANSTIIGNSSTPIKNSVALGAYSKPTRSGEVNIGTGTETLGYNSTSYRVIGGVHDGQLANDAVTVGQINALIDAINTATSSNISHIGS